MSTSVEQKRQAEILNAKVTQTGIKDPLPTLSGMKIQTVGGKSHHGRMYTNPPKIVEEEEVEEKGIFDTMVEELPQVEVEEDDEKKRTGQDKTKTYLKRKKKAKLAKQARKKQRKKKK